MIDMDKLNGKTVAKMEDYNGIVEKASVPGFGYKLTFTDGTTAVFESCTCCDGTHLHYGGTDEPKD